MAEVTQQELDQLAEAQAQLDSFSTGGPPVATQVASFAAAEQTFGAAGSGTAKHVLVDHYFTSSFRCMWAYVDKWRNQTIGSAEEQGLAQIAYASNSVDVWWDASDKLTMIRCWKHF